MSYEVATMQPGEENQVRLVLRYQLNFLGRVYRYFAWLLWLAAAAWGTVVVLLIIQSVKIPAALVH